MRQKAFETTFSTPGGKAQSGALSAKPRVVRGFGQLGIALSEFKVEVLAEWVGFEPTVPCGTLDFESSTFDHSATTPDVASIGRARILSGLEHAQATHVGAQHFGHGNRAVSVLVVLHHGHQRAPHGQARAVEGVHQFVLALGVFEARLQAA